jgi:hypothetical protein
LLLLLWLASSSIVSARAAWLLAGLLMAVVARGWRVLLKVKATTRH